MSDRRYWLMKSEPHVYSYQDLVADGETCWEGVRNYQARNFLREMKVGDRVLYYHSNSKPPHVAGIAEVSREAYPDHYAFDESSKYFDSRSTPDSPRWFMVDLVPVEALPQPVSLADLKAEVDLAEMGVVRKGQRLSVMPVTREHFEIVVRMGAGPTTRTGS